jgi:NCS1 family nucleobase:cation symporter-1
MLAGILPNVPGFLAQASGGSISVAPIFDALYPYAWFVSLFLSGFLHWALTRAFPPKTTTEQPTSITT